MSETHEIQPLFGESLDAQKIWATVEAVWDSRQHLGDVVQFVLNHREQLVAFVQRVPSVLGSAGEAIQGAGEAATRAAHFLAASEDDETLTAPKLAALASTALETCREELAHVSGVVATVAEAVASVHIPDLDLKYSEVAGFRVVSGVHIGSQPLAGGVAEHLAAGVSRLDSITAALETIANRIRNLGDVMANLGENLHAVGQNLSNSGSTLQGLLHEMPAAPGEEPTPQIIGIFQSSPPGNQAA
jgi:methyl-accepting chemotaxis protein